jgi:hypothetical protein
LWSLGGDYSTPFSQFFSQQSRQSGKNLKASAFSTFSIVAKFPLLEINSGSKSNKLLFLYEDWAFCC